MDENSVTFTARSVDNPDKVATFTLQNGHVSVQLGTALLEQVEHTIESLNGDGDSRLAGWIEPVATGALQKVMQPIPLADFQTSIEGDSLQTMAWLRAGGLRLAPIVATWRQVDNPAGAQAFVKEVDARRENMRAKGKMPSLFDYWFTWLVAGIVLAALPVFWWKAWRARRDDK